MPPPDSARPQGPDGSLLTPAFCLRARTCSSSSRRASLLASAPKTRGSSPGCMTPPSAGHGMALARRQGGPHGVVEARGQDIEAGFARVDLVIPEALGRGVHDTEVDDAEESVVARGQRFEDRATEAVLEDH